MKLLSDFADCENPIHSSDHQNGYWLYKTKSYGDIKGELSGNAQLENANTILLAVDELNKKGYSISADAIKKGFCKCL